MKGTDAQYFCSAERKEHAPADIRCERATSHVDKILNVRGLHHFPSPFLFQTRI